MRIELGIVITHRMPIGAVDETLGGVMIRFLVVAWVASFALTGSALAQQEPQGWGGFYFGAVGGYGWGDRDGCTDSGDSCSGEDFDYDQDGWLVGGQIGYNHMIDSVLVGLEVDASFASIKGEGEFDGVPGVGEYDWLASFKGRLGYAMDDFLLYVTGGLALAGYDFDMPIGCQFSQTRDGYLAGGGAEVKISNRASVKVEYNYMDLGDDRQFCAAFAGFVDVVSETDATLNVVKFGFNYLLGGP